ncbi:MAG: DUF192 domain-containing protein [Hyphomonas sp.]
MKQLFSACLILASVAIAPLASAQLETSDLSIVTDQSAHAFVVELADDPEEIQTGLMHRESMDKKAGMLFDFGQPREANMWMKNTLISLDMLFINIEGEVVAIAHNTVPGSLRNVGADVPVKGVLEINGGLAAELGIEPGDVVKHEIFNNIDE